MLHVNVAMHYWRTCMHCAALPERNVVIRSQCEVAYPRSEERRLKPRSPTLRWAWGDSTVRHDSWWLLQRWHYEQSALCAKMNAQNRV
jgi:hypothetical protein